MAHFDVKSFLSDHWRNAPALEAWLKSYDALDVSQAALYKYFVRAAIPANKFGLMLALLEVEQGRPIALAKYLK